MKFVAFIMIAAGIAIGALWPWVQLNYMGRDLGSLKFQQPRPEAQSHESLVLTRDDNPVRIRFRAIYMLEAKLPPVKIPVKVVISDRQGTFLSGVISFSTKGLGTGPERPTVRAGTPLEFSVINDGEHTIELSLAENPNDGGILIPDIDHVTASVIANASELDENYKALAAILALCGFYVLVRSRRSRKKVADKPNHWGRR